MKNGILIYLFILMGFVLILDNSCKKEKKQVPILTTSDVSDITQITATCGGNITSDGGATITARGVCWSTGQTPTIDDSITTVGTGTGSFTSAITGLTANNIYYVRAYATNSIGIEYGNIISFTTLKIDLIIAWENPPDITYGTLLKEKYDLSDPGSFTIHCKKYTQLNADVGYYGTYVYTPPKGTILNIGQGQDLKVDFTPKDTNFNTASKTVKINVLPNTMTDIDGNEYKVIGIGTQIWMAENLRATRYQNGDPIPNVTEDSLWITLNDGAFCWYANNYSTYGATYGALYNGYAVADARKICPTNWHLSTDAEWNILTNYIGQCNYASLYFQPSDWDELRYNSGFNALLTGFRLSYDIGDTFFGSTVWWSGTDGWSRELVERSDLRRHNYGKRLGYSVRCVKD